MPKRLANMRDAIILAEDSLAASKHTAAIASYFLRPGRVSDKPFHGVLFHARQSLDIAIAAIRFGENL